MSKAVDDLAFHHGAVGTCGVALKLTTQAALAYNLVANSRQVTKSDLFDVSDKLALELSSIALRRAHDCNYVLIPRPRFI